MYDWVCLLTSIQGNEYLYKVHYKVVNEIFEVNSSLEHRNMASCFDNL